MGGSAFSVGVMAGSSISKARGEWIRRAAPQGSAASREMRGVKNADAWKMKGGPAQGVAEAAGEVAPESSDGDCRSTGRHE